jgi:hypothetical protein
MAGGKYRDLARYVFRVLSVTRDSAGHAGAVRRGGRPAALYGILGHACDLGLTIIQCLESRRASDATPGRRVDGYGVSPARPGRLPFSVDGTKWLDPDDDKRLPNDWGSEYSVRDVAQ